MPGRLSGRKFTLEIEMYDRDVPSELCRYLAEYVDKRMQDFDKDLSVLQDHLLEAFSRFKGRHTSETRNVIALMNDVLKEV